MRSKEFCHVKVSGLACAVPDNIVSTDAYVDFYGVEAVEKFKKATGVKSRFLSDGTQTASDLCFVAANSLLKKKGIEGTDIDAVILVTQTPDYAIPSTAYVLHKRLGVKKDCLVFDINLGCSAFVEGVYVIAGLIESKTISKALLLVGDSNTNRQKTENTSFTMMFGDAGSATLLEYADEGSPVRGMIRSDGDGFNTLITPLPGYRFPGQLACGGNGQRMDNADVFLFAITQVPKLFKEFFSLYDCSVDSFDYCLLHQANLMIVNQVAKKIKFSPEKVPISLDRYGNTDGASIPVGIVDLCETLKQRQKLKLIMSGFGIGLSWGVLSFEIDNDDVLPIIKTKDFFEEGKNVL